MLLLPGVFGWLQNQQTPFQLSTAVCSTPRNCIAAPIFCDSLGTPDTGNNLSGIGVDHPGKLVAALGQVFSWGFTPTQQLCRAVDVSRWESSPPVPLPIQRWPRALEQLRNAELRIDFCSIKPLRIHARQPAPRPFSICMRSTRLKVS